MNDLSIPLRERVEALQHEMLQQPQYEPPTAHLFHGGMYCRQVWRPAGCLIVGKVHKKEHLYMVVFGTVHITTDDGIQVVTGPYLMCSKPGTKRAVYAETDSLCITIHRADATDVESVEDELVEKDPNTLFAVGNKIKPLEVQQ